MFPKIYLSGNYFPGLFKGKLAKILYLFQIYIKKTFFLPKEMFPKDIFQRANLQKYFPKGTFFKENWPKIFPKDKGIESLLNKLRFSNPSIFAIWWHVNLWYFKLRNLIKQNLQFRISKVDDVGLQSGFVAKALSLRLGFSQLTKSSFKLKLHRRVIH